MVEKGETQSIEKICQYSNELSGELLLAFNLALDKYVIDVASTILQKFPQDKRLWKAMDAQIDRGGVVRVMKNLDGMQHKEYAAIIKIFAKTNAATYLSVLPEIITLGMERAGWSKEDMIPLDKTRDDDSRSVDLALVEKVQSILKETEESCYQPNQSFITQPARFLEWFICLVNPEIAIVLKEQFRTVHASLDMPNFHQ